MSEVRLAGVDDAGALASLRRDWTEERAGEPIVDDDFGVRFQAWFDREHDQRVTWLGVVDDRPVAMLNLLVFTRMPEPRDAVHRRPTEWGYLANFFVRAEHRGSGLGRLLMEACTAYADTRGLARIVLNPSTRSVPLYARHGFVPATALMVRPGGA